MIKAVVVAVVVTLAMILAGCKSTGGYGAGGTSGSSGTTPSAAGGSAAGGRVIRTIAVKETEFKLNPATITLSKPGTYAFRAENKGTTQHSLTVEGKGVDVTLKSVLNPGQSGVLKATFKKPGTYVMFCPVDGHRQLGMQGKVVVK